MKQIPARSFISTQQFTRSVGMNFTTVTTSSHLSKHPDMVYELTHDLMVPVLIIQLLTAFGACEMRGIAPRSRLQTTLSMQIKTDCYKYIMRMLGCDSGSASSKKPQI